MQQHPEVVRGDAETLCHVSRFFAREQSQLDSAARLGVKGAYAVVDYALELVCLEPRITAPRSELAQGDRVHRSSPSAAPAHSGCLSSEDAEQERSHVRASFKARNDLEERGPDGLGELVGFDRCEAEAARCSDQDRAVRPILRMNCTPITPP